MSPRRHMLATKSSRPFCTVLPNGSENYRLRVYFLALGPLERLRKRLQANSDVCNNIVSRDNEIKPGAGDENRTRILNLESG